MATQSIILTGADRKAAYHWLIRRDRNAPPELEASFQQWLGERPQNRKAYDEAAKLWHMLREPAVRVAGRADCRPGLRAHGSPSFFPLALAASTIFAIGVSFWMADPAFVQNWRADVVTARGETLSYALPDGSTAMLAPDTALAFDFVDGKQREVHVLRGEAFFQVKHGLESRFVVNAGGGHVEVTGTAFDVDRHGDDLSVTVESGSVKVSGANSEHSLSLGPSEKVTVESGQPGFVEKVDLGLELGWMTGQVVFDRQPLSRITATLQRYTEARIVTRGSVGSQLVSGSFPTNDPEEALRAIAATVGARIQYVTPWVVIVF